MTQCVYWNKELKSIKHKMFYFVVEMEQFRSHVHTKLVQRKIEFYMKEMEFMVPPIHLYLIVGLHK